MITMTIQFDPTTGAVKVDGPIDNKMLAYAILEIARDCVKDHNAARAKSPIVPVAAPVLQLTRT